MRRNEEGTHYQSINNGKKRRDANGDTAQSPSFPQ
jgi:hypothetical protein